MNAPFELALPVNPEVCWQICVALLHTAWQVLLLWLVVFVASRQKIGSAHSRFRLSFACLMLAGCLPLINYYLLGTGSALPQSIANATRQFESSGSMSLFRPSELVANDQISEKHKPRRRGGQYVQLLASQHVDHGRHLLSAWRGRDAVATGESRGHSTPNPICRQFFRH